MINIYFLRLYSVILFPLITNLNYLEKKDSIIKKINKFYNFKEEI